MNARDEAVRLLLEKAAQDELAAVSLASLPKVGDELVGFHLQQAAEKRLKALLMHEGIAYRRTHDVLELVDLLAGSGTALPPELEPLQELTPFAVEYRYESYGDSCDDPLDRNQAIKLVADLGDWVESLIQATRKS